MLKLKLKSVIGNIKSRMKKMFGRKDISEPSFVELFQVLSSKMLKQGCSGDMVLVLPPECADVVAREASGKRFSRGMEFVVAGGRLSIEPRVSLSVFHRAEDPLMPHEKKKLWAREYHQARRRGDSLIVSELLSEARRLFDNPDEAKLHIEVMERDSLDASRYMSPPYTMNEFMTTMEPERKKLKPADPSFMDELKKL